MKVWTQVVAILCCLFVVCEAIYYDPCGYNCYDTPCLNYTMKECVGHLWDVPQNLTSNVKELKCAIKSLVEKANSRVLAYLIGLSLWSVDYFSEMPVTTSLHPSCIHGSLVNYTMVNSLINDPCVKAGFKKAIINYGGLTVNALDNTLYVGMRRAGCKIKSPCKTPVDPRCIGSAGEMFMADKTIDIPASLKPILSKLANSPHPDDGAVAAAAFSTGVKGNMDVFEESLCVEPFIKAVQLKCCNVKIPQECCSKREKDLRYWIEALRKNNQKYIDAGANL